MVVLASTIAFFFAMNIGASGTAAAMGSAYGGGAVNRTQGLWLVAVFALLGAIVGSGPVVKTISGGIVPAQAMGLQVALVVLVAATITLFGANLIGVPLSTSEVTVGSLIGVGLALNSLYLDRLIIIVASWVVLPGLAFGIAYVLGRFLYQPLNHFLASLGSLQRIQRILAGLLITAGCYEAFAAGTNNVANAVGPLVGAGLIDVNTAILLGGLALSAGAITMGRRVMETNGKKITQLCLLKACMISFTAGTLVLIASGQGLPVPLTQATTMAIIGIGCSQDGLPIWNSAIVRTIIRTWILSPIISMAIAYTAMRLLLS